MEAALHEIFGFEGDVLVRISEVSCGAYGCADVVTAVFVMRPGRKTEAYRVGKPLGEVAVADLLDALSPTARPPGVRLAQALDALGRQPSDPHVRFDSDV